MLLKNCLNSVQVWIPEALIFAVYYLLMFTSLYAILAKWIENARVTWQGTKRGKIMIESLPAEEVKVRNVKMKIGRNNCHFGELDDKFYQHCLQYNSQFFLLTIMCECRNIQIEKLEFHFFCSIFTKFENELVSY